MEESILKEALETYGIKAQREKLYEELAELQEALYKFRDGKVKKDAVITEVADVTIMLAQMALEYGEAESRVAYEELLESLKGKYEVLTDLYVCQAAKLLLVFHLEDNHPLRQLLTQLIAETELTVSYIAYNLYAASETKEAIDFKMDRLKRRLENDK